MATAEAFPDAIRTINSWYDQGHRICFFTARTEDHREVTEQWLLEKGFRYHTLLMGKPRGELSLDRQPCSTSYKVQR